MYILLICTILSTIILFFICNKKIGNSEEIHDENISPIVKEIGDNEKLASEILNYLGRWKK